MFKIKYDLNVTTHTPNRIHISFKICLYNIFFQKESFHFS